MNLNLIDEILPLLSPAARKYLREIRNGKRPVTLAQGISDVPEGLTAAGTRALHRIAQTQDPTQLNISNIVNSGILIRRLRQQDMGRTDLPKSQQQLFDRLYSIRGGTGVPTAGPAAPPVEQTRMSSSRVPGQGSAQGSRTQTGASSGNTAFLQGLSRYLQSKYRNYLLKGGGYSSVLELPPNQRLTADEVKFLDLVRENPAGLRVEDLLPYMSDTSGDNIQNVREFLAPVSSQQQAPVQPPLSIEAVAAGQVQPGSVPISDIEPGELSRPTRPPLSTGAGNIEPGELSRPGTATTAGAAVPGGGSATYLGIGTPAGQNIPSFVAARTGQTTGNRTGGGDVPGVVPGVVPETGMVDTGVPPDWETAAAEMYPEYYAIVKNNPEIADLLRRSLGPPEWSPEKFDAELKKTNWYKTTQASAREWDLASGLDPATYQARVDEAAAAINAEALSYGIRLSDEQLQKLALDSQRLNFGTQQITNAIGMLAVEGGTEGATQLRNGFYGQQVRQTARQYGVTLNDTTFNSFVNKIAVGEESIGSFQDYAMTIAKSLYPTLAEQFDAGRTFEDATSSYKVIAANLLEKDEGEIDMTRPEWVQAITYQPDPKTGEQRLMNMREWQDYLRQTESLGYQYTSEARGRAYKVATELANLFGRL